MSAGEAVRTTLRGVGQTLITLGVVVLLFCVYEVWFTNVYTNREQSRLGDDLRTSWTAPVPTTSPEPGTKLVGVSLGTGIAVIWIEHVVRALTATVSRLICLAGGQFVGDGEPAAVLANPAVREVFLGSELTASLSGGTLTAEVGDPGEGA